MQKMSIIVTSWLRGHKPLVIPQSTAEVPNITSSNLFLSPGILKLEERNAENSKFLSNITFMSIHVLGLSQPSNPKASNSKS